MRKTNLENLFAKGLLWSGVKDSNSRVLGGELACSRACFCLEEIDRVLIPGAGLELGVVHEWALSTGGEARARRQAPLSILSILIGNLLALRKEARQKEQFIAWLGRGFWPSSSLLERTLKEGWEKSCLFIDVDEKQRRLWCTLQLLLSESVSILVADGSGLKPIAIRKLKHAAARSSALFFLMRSPEEIVLPSAAQTKWRVSPIPSRSENPCWSLELLRSRGLVRPISWSVELVEDETTGKKNSLNLLSDVEHRAGSAQSRERGKIFA